MSCSPTYASNQELSSVYTPLQEWLVANGRYALGEGHLNKDTHHGLPLVEGPPPYYVFDVLPSKAREHASAFAKIFEVGAEVQLRLDVRHYQMDGVAPDPAKQITEPFELRESGLAVSVAKIATSPISSETITLEPSGNTFLVDRTTEERTHIPGKVIVSDTYRVEQGRERSVRHEEYIGLVCLLNMLSTMPATEIKPEDMFDILLRRINDEL